MRLNGCLPRKTAVCSVHPHLSDRGPLIPRSNWRSYSFAHKVPAIKDQNGQSSCTAFTGAGLLQTLRRISGLPHVDLSAGNLYARINGGRDAGSSIDDGVQEVMTRGVCLASRVPDLGWRAGLPRGWDAEAKDYRGLDGEVYEAPDLDALGSGLQQGFPAWYGIDCGASFDSDVNGILPEFRHAATVRGHSVYAVGLVIGTGQPLLSDVWPRPAQLPAGSIYLVMVNSWGTDWGLDGLALMPVSYLRLSVYGGFVIRAVTATGAIA